MQNNNVIEIVLQLINQATDPLKKATGEINKQLDGVRRSFVSIGGLIGTALGGWSLVKLIQNVNEADKVAAQLDNAFKNLGKNAGVTRQQLDDLAASVQRSTTFGDEAVKQAEAQLLTFTKVQGEAFERTIRLSADMAAAMGTDISGAARMLGRALQDPQIGMMMLRRVGVSLTAQQRELIKSMVDVGDTAGAQAKILGLLEDRYRGAAAAMRNTLGGAITGLQNALGDLVEGDRDSFAGAVQAINEFAKTVENPQIKAGFDTLIAGIAKLIEWLVKLASAFGLALEGYRLFAEGLAKQVTGNTLGTEVLDVLYARLQRLQDEQRNTEGLPSALRVRTLEQIKKDVEEVRKQIGQAQDEYIATQRAMTAARGGALAAVQPPEPKIDVEETIGAFKKIQEGLRTEVEKTSDALREQQKVIDNIRKISDEDLAASGLKRSDVDQVVKRMEASLAAVKAKAASAMKDSTKEVLTFAQMTDRALRDLDATITNDLLRDVRSLGQETTDMLGTMAEAWKPIEEKIPLIQEFALEAFRGIQTAMANFLFDPFAEGLDGMLKGFVDMIRRMVAELVAQQILQAFFSSLAGVGGGVGNFFSALASSAGSAGGGIIPAGMPRWVGEDGPELIMPTAQSDVFNMRELMFGMSKGGGQGTSIVINQNIDARGADAARIMAIMPGLLQRSKQETIAAVADLQRRGRLG